MTHTEYKPAAHSVREIVTGHGNKNTATLQLSRTRKLRPPDFQDNRHMKVVRLLALHKGRLYPQEIFLGIHLC
jgi:hypothetical protein